jgi:hypothetical protein
LATLLAVMTAIALLLWGVPEWREYQRRMEFEREACQLVSDFRTTLPWQSEDPLNNRTWSTTHFTDVADKIVACTPVYFKHYWYCIYAHEEELSDSKDPRAVELRKFDSDWPVVLRTQVHVYRLAPMPRGYRPQTESGKATVTWFSDGNKRDRTPRDQYLMDFYEILAGRENRDLGIRYELIHTDPPLATD